MWGKITQIAEKLDETYGSRDVDDDDNDDDDNDDDDNDDDDDDMEGEEDGGSGWDDSNDFDDDELDFENDDDDDNDDEEGNDESAPIDAANKKNSEEDVSSLNATMNDHDDDGTIGKVDDNKDGIAEESMDDFGNGFGDDFDDLDFGDDDDDDDDIGAEIIDQSQTPSKSSKDEKEEELNNDNIVNTSSSDNNNALDNAFGDDEDFGDLDDSIHNEVEVEEEKEKEEAVVIKDDDTAIDAANNNSNNASPTTTTTVKATLAASELAAMTAVDPVALAEPPVTEKMKTTTALLHEELSGENVPAAALPSNSSNENDTIANNSDNGNNAVDKNNNDDANSNNDVNNAPRVVTVSAPGKALVAGGYLVLEQPNPGVVLAAKGCRFHSTVMFRPCYNIEGASFSAGSAGSAGYAGFGGVGGAHTTEEKAPWKNIPLDVYSPQFHQVFTYTLSYSSLDSSPRVNYQASTTTSTPSTSLEDGSNHLTTLRLQPRKHINEGDDQKSSNGNKFVEKSLLLALGYLHKCLGGVEFHSRVQQHQQQQQQQQQQHQQPNGKNEAMALAIKLRADNDFYSQITHLKERGMDLTPQNMELLEPFLPCPKSNNCEEEDGGSSGSKVVVNKTGLGSSAALVTSLVGALLNFFGVISLPNTSASIEEHDSKPVLSNGSDEKEKEGLRIAHNLSQICHCYAQGKVGSGFDVSSAVFGSHIYTRFSKGLIGKFLDVVHKGGGSSFSMTESTSQQLLDIVNDVDNQWDCTVSPINLPPGLELLMADVCGGSESPSMAKRILDWKKNKRKVGFLDDYYWKDLKRCNKKIVSLLTDTFVSQSVRDGLRRDGAMILANRTAEQWKKPMPSSWHEFEGSSWDVAAKLLDLRMAILESRQNLKGMGKAAGVPVEPEEQTALANATMALPGVVAAGVPGAGGYDALFVIYVKGPETCDGKSDRVRDEIGNLWREMSNASSENNVVDGEVTVVCPLSVRAAGFGGDSGLCATNLDW